MPVSTDSHTPVAPLRLTDHSTSDAELRAHLERILDAQYELAHEVGRGGMGIVYRARDRRLKRLVAVKVLPPELAFRAEIRTRFLREAEMAAQLNHPNIVPIYTVDEREGLVYFVMAFVEGDNLAKRIHERGPMDPEDARRILRDVADALSYAHSRQVIHRDIKPDNILLDSMTGRPMVTDFGIARAVSEGADARLTATGIAIGTPAYMSPEQSAGDREVDGRSDLYSLGVVAYQMLSGELPFTASSTPAMLVKHLSEQPAPLHLRRPTLPTDLAASVMCLLEKDPSDRFPNAQALVDSLDGVGDIPQPRTQQAGVPRPAPAWSPVPSSAADDVTTEDLIRWHAPDVERFRRKLKPYLVVNSVLMVISLFSTKDFLPITAFWSIYLAFKYAKLWSAGYDWRDVFKQPRDRLAFDVIAEWIDDMRALFHRDKRAEVRARWRSRQQRGGLLAPPPAPPAPVLPRVSGLPDAHLSAVGPTHGNMMRQALQDRDEISRALHALPSRERRKLGDVRDTANALAQRVQSLAAALAAIDQAMPNAALERDIAELESQANPLDRDGSESRVRRLAALKRDRRLVADRERKRAELEEKVESCAIALQNLRFDLLRLQTGATSPASVTQIAEHAMTLARDVDGLIAANAEVERRGASAQR
jgi:serine/threonine protein kinase